MTGKRKRKIMGNVSMPTDQLLEKAVAQIRGQELKILEDFAKAYLASMSFLCAKDIAWMIEHLQLNQQKVDDPNHFGYKYWYSFREDSANGLDKLSR